MDSPTICEIPNMLLRSLIVDKERNKLCHKHKEKSILDQNSVFILHYTYYVHTCITYVNTFIIHNKEQKKQKFQTKFLLRNECREMKGCGYQAVLHGVKAKLLYRLVCPPLRIELILVPV